MNPRSKPMQLRLYGGRVIFPWATMGYAGMICIIVLGILTIAVKSGLGQGPLILIFMIGCVAVGVVMIRSMIENHNRPVFYADRDGFRIGSGRMRLWRDFHGARVVRVSGKYGETEEQVQVKVRPSGMFAHRTTAVVKASDYGQGMVDHIIVFKHELEDLWAEEAKRMDPRISPVVAARELRNRTPRAPVSFWQMCVETVAELPGRTQKG